MIAPVRLFELCERVRDAVIDGFANAGVDLPERRYVANGQQQVAYDCEQMTVAHQISQGHTGSVVNLGLSANPRAAEHSLRAALIVVSIVRCGPKPTSTGQRLIPPTVEAEESSAAEIYADGQLALNSIQQAQKDGDLGSCSSVAFLDLQTPGTAGLYASSVLRVQIGME